MSVIRRVPGVVAPDRIVDIETRRVAQSIQARVQWMLDNWPDAVKPLAFDFSVRNYNGHVQLVGDTVPAKVRRFYGHDASGALGWFTFPDSADVKFQMSVINNSGIVTLVNDEEDPDYGQFYGVGANDTKGWQYPIEHPWRWQQKSKDSGNLTAGLVRINGVNKNHGQPASLSGFTESMRYWVEVDTTAETATWTSGTLATTPIFPVGDDHTIIFPILTVYVEKRPETIDGEEVQVPYITGFVQERWCHIALGAAATEEPNPVDPYEFIILSRDGNDPPQGPGDSTAKQDFWNSGQVKGLHQWVNFGTVWDGYAATPTLYNQMRQMIVTTKGKVRYTGVETRITIDVPVNHALLPPP